MCTVSATIHKKSAKWVHLNWRNFMKAAELYKDHRPKPLIDPVSVLHEAANVLGDSGVEQLVLTQQLMADLNTTLTNRVT